MHTIIKMRVLHVATAIKIALTCDVTNALYLHEEADGGGLHPGTGEHRQSHEVLDAQVGRHTLDQGDDAPVGH